MLYGIKDVLNSTNSNYSIEGMTKINTASAKINTVNPSVKPKRKTVLHELVKNKILFMMLIPGLTVLLLNNYLPMFGILMAFKNFKSKTGNFFWDLLSSEWVGFKNFEFFIKTDYAFIITRNTILFNLAFIFLHLVFCVGVAIMLSELRNRLAAKFYQTVMFLPNFLSWVVVSYLVYGLLSTDMGFINKSIIEPLGFEPISWYTEPKLWIAILPMINLWKGLGYGTIVYYAGITNIDTEMYEAAIIDGASKLKQISYITIPMLTPLMIILTLLSIGRIFFSDFGLFFQTTKNSGLLYDVTLVIDTYVYNGLKVMGDASMSAAAGLYQASVGLILILVSNYIVKKIDKDYVLF